MFLNKPYNEHVKTRTLINSQLLVAPDSQRRLAGVWLIHKTGQIERFTASLLCFGFNTKTKQCLHVEVKIHEQCICLNDKVYFSFIHKWYYCYYVWIHTFTIDTFLYKWYVYEPCWRYFISNEYERITWFYLESLCLGHKLI